MMTTRDVASDVVYSNNGSRVTCRIGLGGTPVDLLKLINVGNAFDNIVTKAHSEDANSRVQKDPVELPMFVSVYTGSWVGGYLVEVAPSRENLRLINSLSNNGFKKFVQEVTQMLMDEFPGTIMAFSDRCYN